MSAPALNNVSSDLIWAIVRDNHCFLSKSRSNGGAQFSSDPLNLTNKNTRKVRTPMPGNRDVSIFCVERLRLT
ncbi:putative 60S ribosomal protein L28e [Beauveria bassiana]|uniref:Putative 60S ribosomal protein L28e n=1 Tax=Beauveria bassiana TaxID=176275 RepID=A0A2N6NDW0_BEABA|nr:putative 60S ribosomal protein L28e [Beauveria bassiana]